MSAPLDFQEHFASEDTPAIIHGLGRRALYTDGAKAPLRPVTVILNDPYVAGTPLDFGVATAEISAWGLLSELGTARRGGRLEIPGRLPYQITAVEPRPGTGSVRLILAQS